MEVDSSDIEQSDNLQSDNGQPEMEHDGAVNIDHDQQHGSDSGTDNEPQHDENGEGEAKQDVNQEAINERIAKQHAKYREEQRRRIAAEERLQQFEKSGSNNQDPEPQLVQVDPYADDVDEQIRKRDESIREHLQWQNRQSQRQQELQTTRQQSVQQQQAEAAEQAERFFEQAKADGVDQDKLNKAIQTIGQYGLGHDVAEYLLNDAGHHVTLALANNPTMMADLSYMPERQRALYIERNVRSKINVAPRRSNSKPPATRVQGRASDAKDRYPLTGGKVTVE